MNKQKENLFAEKFRLLNSQEHTENINWSSSDTSEFENTSHCDKNCNLPNKVRMKRKRKKKLPKNVSNLNITILDTSKSPKDARSSNTLLKTGLKTEKSDLEMSPIFVPTAACFPPYKCIKTEQTSPILTCKVNTQQNKRIIPDKSPILLLKYSSPKVSPNVRKTLFKEKQKFNQNLKQIKSNIRDSKANANNEMLDRRKKEDKINSTNNPVIMTKQDPLTDIPNIAENKRPKIDNILSDTRQNSLEIINPEITVKKEITIESSQESSSVKTGESLKLVHHSLDDSFAMLRTSNVELAKRVQSYFENHFSSENATQYSQCSINDTPTPKNTSKSSEDVEILSINTQINSKIRNSQSEQEQDMLSKHPSTEPSQSLEIGREKSKKVRYKKDGLSHRLNTLLKKQTANISLWQHERFLAANSNFVIPKEEHLVVRIQKVSFKYGAFLLETVDIDSFKFLIIINSVYVQNVNLTENMILKLYDPYKIVDFNRDCKLILNTCKFEVIDLSE